MIDSDNLFLTLNELLPSLKRELLDYFSCMPSNIRTYLQIHCNDPVWRECFFRFDGVSRIHKNSNFYRFVKDINSTEFPEMSIIESEFCTLLSMITTKYGGKLNHKQQYDLKNIILNDSYNLSTLKNVHKVIDQFISTVDDVEILNFILFDILPFKIRGVEIFSKIFSRVYDVPEIECSLSQHYGNLLSCLTNDFYWDNFFENIENVIYLYNHCFTNTAEPIIDNLVERYRKLSGIDIKLCKKTISDFHSITESTYLLSDDINYRFFDDVEPITEISKDVFLYTKNQISVFGDNLYTESVDETIQRLQAINIDTIKKYYDSKHISFHIPDSDLMGLQQEFCEKTSCVKIKKNGFVESFVIMEYEGCPYILFKDKNNVMGISLYDEVGFKNVLKCPNICDEYKFIAEK